MVLNPEVQKRAQAEIDAVVGTVRLPDFDDRSSLPYVEAIYRETLRWHPVAPLGKFVEIHLLFLISDDLGVSHATSVADVYGGYFIPHGMIPIYGRSTLLTLHRRYDHHECLVKYPQFLTVIHLIFSRAMTRNETKYPRPEEFRPERFFDAAGELNNDNVQYIFGGGRRICPGRHLADASIWSAIAIILATLDIVKCKDEQGNDIPINAKWTSGVTSYVSYYRGDFLKTKNKLAA